MVGVAFMFSMSAATRVETKKVRIVFIVSLVSSLLLLGTVLKRL